MKKEILLFLTAALASVCISTHCYGNEPEANSEGEVNQALQGWVRMSFEITEYGIPDNIKVIDSSPPGTFDREAVKALSKWKYKPKVVDGIAVRQTNLKVQLDFVLEDAETNGN